MKNYILAAAIFAIMFFLSLGQPKRLLLKTIENIKAMTRVYEITIRVTSD